jgi:hypothetical protein
MAKKFAWWQAAEIIGMSDHERPADAALALGGYWGHGYDGLLDRRVDKPSPRRLPVAVAEQVLGLCQRKCFALNVRYFHETLERERQIRPRHTWLKKAMRGAGLVRAKRKRGVHRRRRGATTFAGDAAAHRCEPASAVSG